MTPKISLKVCSLSSATELALSLERSTTEREVVGLIPGAGTILKVLK